MRSQPFSKPYRASILLVGDAELDDPAYTRWFNTAAFAAQPINTIGETVVARNFLHGPSQRRLDLSLFKDFVRPERPAAGACRGVQRHQRGEFLEPEWRAR